MQKDHLTYTAFKSYIDTSVLALTSLITTDGPYLAAVKKHLPTTPDSTEFEHKGHIVKDSAKDRDKTHEAARQLVEEVVTRLEAAVPDAGKLHALILFDPSQISRDATQEDLVRHSTNISFVCQ